MSAMDITPPAEASAPVTAAVSLGERVDAWLEWLGDKLNPIVVKEARQALKSRQFTLTFSLLLVCGACWTAIAVAMRMPEVFRVPSGHEIVTGYYFILCIPMLLIVPFVAYRSLAAEREDGTFELLSITTLRSWQIVLGKLASAMLQMMVYYSALAPCIAFTYLLKGVDIITIVLFLGFLWLASMLLSAIALAVGTITRARHWQVMLSVLLVAGLMLFLASWLTWSAIAFDAVLMKPPYDQPNYWMFLLAVATFCMTFVVFFLTLAAGQISFASDNRSTPIRWVTFSQHCLWFGWMTYLMQQRENIGVEFIYFVYLFATTVALIYWWIMGSFLIGERAELSPRVRRSLPQSELGRTFLTWFNPGSGTGFVFTLVNFGGFAIVLAFLGWEVFSVGVPPGRMRFSPDMAWFYGVATFGYLSAYLGVGRLLVLSVRHRVPNSVWFSFLLQIVLVAFGTLIPLVTQFSLMQNFNNDYTLLQLTNPFWTLAEVVMDSSQFSVASQAAFIVCVFGGTMTLLHFYLAALEISQTRVLAPQRVLEEDAAAAAARIGPKRKNPWDDPVA